MFQLSYDPDKTLLTVVQQGYWSLDDFRAFETEFLTLHAAIGRTHPSYRVIADCRDYAVQSAEVGAAFGILFEKLMAENKGRYAVLAATALNKMQAKRALPQSNVRVFTEQEEAMTWLFEEGSLPG